jgi:Na+-driven multidrug efflux pump
MINILDKIYSVDSITKNKQILGELPTTKEAYRNAINMAWPSAAEAVLVGLVASIDTMMVGSIQPEEVGTAAIAAVGITNQPKFILLAIIFSLNVGVTAIVARRKGRGRPGRSQ